VQLNRNLAVRGVFDFLRTKGGSRGGLQIREPGASQSRGQRRVEAMEVEIYADIICPWCYAGVRRFGRALAQFPGASSVEVRYRPYRLDAHAPPTAVRLLPLLEKQLDRRRQRLVRYTRAIVSEVTRDEGIEIAWERILRVDTSSAHRLLALAWREYGSAVQRGLVERLFEAHFTRGANVADHRLLTTLAAAEGMDPGQVRVYLASGDGADELRCDLEDARRRVNGVPTFIFNGELALDGSQDLPTFLHTLEAVGAVGTGKADRRTRFSVPQGADL
jgi:predicted DsbA family dithiol-disulfide isomerase